MKAELWKWIAPLADVISGAVDVYGSAIEAELLKCTAPPVDVSRAINSQNNVL